MKKKIYLVCTHPRDTLKLGGIYLFDKLASHNNRLCTITDLNYKHFIIAHLFVSRFKKFTDIEQAKFMAIKIKLGVIKISKSVNKQTCDRAAQACIC